MERTAPYLSQFEKWTYPFSRTYSFCCTFTLTSPTPLPHQLQPHWPFPVPLSAPQTDPYLRAFALQLLPSAWSAFPDSNSSFLLFLQGLLQYHFLKEACSDPLLNTPGHLPYSLAKAGLFWVLFAVLQSTHQVIC